MLPARRGGGGGGGRGRRRWHAPTPPAPADPRAAAAVAVPHSAEGSVPERWRSGRLARLCPALLAKSRDSSRPRIPRRCLFLLAEMTRRLPPPENISKWNGKRHPTAARGGGAGRGTGMTRKVPPLGVGGWAWGGGSAEHLLPPSRGQRGCLRGSAASSTELAFAVWFWIFSLKKASLYGRERFVGFLLFGFRGFGFDFYFFFLRKARLLSGCDGRCCRTPWGSRAGGRRRCAGGRCGPVCCGLGEKRERSCTSVFCLPHPEGAVMGQTEVRFTSRVAVGN